MNNKRYYSASLLGILMIAVAFTGASSPSGPIAMIALVSKVVQDVTKKTVSTDWAKAQKGDLLASGDGVKTGEKSIAVVKFKDNSILRLREKAELKVQGETTGDAFSKSVYMNRGQIGFEVQKRENQKFTFTSPTSVASIRGTKGMLETTTGGDELVVTEGKVNLLNSISNKALDVPAGQTGTSRTDGTIEVHPTTPQERGKALSALRAGDDSRLNELRIELRNQQGSTKELKIQYRD